MGIFPFSQNFLANAPFLKLFREMLLFWNLIFGQSSYSELKILKNKNKKNSGTRVPWKDSSGTLVLYIELKFMELEFQIFILFFIFS